MTVYIPVVLAVVILSSTLVYALNKNKLLNIQTILAISTGSVVLSVMFPFILSMFADYNAPQASNLGVLWALLLTIVVYVTLIFLLTILISSFISEKKAKEIQKSLENSSIAKLAGALSQLAQRWKEGMTAKAAENLIEADEQKGIAPENVENSEDVEITGIKTMEETQNILEKSVDSEQNIDKMGLGTFYPAPDGANNNEDSAELLETGADEITFVDMATDMTDGLQQEDGEYPLEIEELAIGEETIPDDTGDLYEEIDLVDDVQDIQEVGMEITPVEESDASEMEVQEIEVAEETWENVDFAVLDETESLDTVEVQESDIDSVPVEEEQDTVEMDMQEAAAEEEIPGNIDSAVFDETEILDAHEVQDIQEVDVEPIPVDEELDAIEVEVQEIEVAEETWENIDIAVLDEAASPDTVEVQEAEVEPVPAEETQDATGMGIQEIESAEETSEDVGFAVLDKVESLDTVEDEVQESDIESVPVEEEQDIVEAVLQESAAAEETLEDTGAVLLDEPENRGSEAESGGKEGMTEMNIDKSLSVDEYIDEAFRLKQCGDPEGAILYYMYSLDKNPDRGLVFWIILDICVLYKELGQAELAREILESYIASYGDVMDATVKAEIEKNLL